MGKAIHKTSAGVNSINPVSSKLAGLPPPLEIIPTLLHFGNRKISNQTRNGCVWPTVASAADANIVIFFTGSLLLTEPVQEVLDRTQAPRDTIRKGTVRSQEAKEEKQKQVRF